MNVKDIFILVFFVIKEKYYVLSKKIEVMNLDSVDEYKEL